MDSDPRADDKEPAPAPAAFRVGVVSPGRAVFAVGGAAIGMMALAVTTHRSLDTTAFSPLAAKAGRGTRREQSLLRHRWRGRY